MRLGTLSSTLGTTTVVVMVVVHLVYVYMLVQFKKRKKET
jgi:hypothetical protein